MAELTFLERRRVQMEYVVPLVRGLQEVLGEEVVIEALEELGRRRLASATPVQEADFSGMDDMVGMFAAGDALDYDVIASTADSYDLNITRCGYAEMMEELGGRELGHLLICNGDFVSAAEMGMSLSRTQTRMQGADHCDFRYRSAKPA